MNLLRQYLNFSLASSNLDSFNREKPHAAQTGSHSMLYLVLTENASSIRFSDMRVSLSFLMLTLIH
jgi:hypothetical protein